MIGCGQKEICQAQDEVHHKQLITYIQSKATNILILYIMHSKNRALRLYVQKWSKEKTAHSLFAKEGASYHRNEHIDALFFQEDRNI